MNCPLCHDTGEVCTYWPTSVDDAPEYAPCSCPAGLALEAFATQAAIHTLTVHLTPTIEDRNNER